MIGRKEVQSKPMPCAVGLYLDACHEDGRVGISREVHRWAEDIEA